MMEVTKGQLVSGLVRFAKVDVLPKIPDKGLKVTLSAFINLIELKPEAVDVILNSPFLKSENGLYDIDLLEQVISKSFDEHGDFTITIPSIRFISPTEKEMRFASEDVRKVKSYIES